MGRQLLVFGKWIAESEELPRDDDEPPTQRSGSSPLAWLTSPDQLPNLTASELGRRGLVPWLASQDHLPNRSEPSRPERGFLGWVTARENLPTPSSERTPASRSIFRWLLTSESHDRLESLRSIKEVPPHEP
jgi:hypothetical protein